MHSSRPHTALLALFFVVLLLPETGHPAETAPIKWKAALTRAWRDHAAGRFPQSRLAIRQACAYGLERNDWRAVYEGFIILQDSTTRGETIPAYFQTYLERASCLPGATNSHLACRLFARIFLARNNPDHAIPLAVRSIELALDAGLTGDALQAASLLLPENTGAALNHESVQAWIAIARTSLSSRSWSDTLQAAGLMHKADLHGLAREWINRAAAMALANNDTVTVNTSCALLIAAGYPDEAAVWQQRLRSVSGRPSASNGNG